MTEFLEDRLKKHNKTIETAQVEIKGLAEGTPEILQARRMIIHTAIKICECMLVLNEFKTRNRAQS